jgi:glutamate 5-kinase
MVIMNGQADAPVTRLLKGEACTLFATGTDPLAVRKRWIQGMMAPKGFLHIDAGAVEALKNGASLLPAGVTETLGDFDRGDMVAFVGPDGHTVGQGLVSYAYPDAVKLQGKSMRDAASILGYAGRSALVHRDDLVLL